MPLQAVEIPQLHLVDMAGLFMMLGCAIVILGIVKLARQRLCPHISLKDPQMALETGVILTMEQQFELLSRKLDGVEAIKEQLEAQGQQLGVLTGQASPPNPTRSLSHGPSPKHSVQNRLPYPDCPTRTLLVVITLQP